MKVATPRAEPLTHLLALPFTPYEESLIQAYALGPPSSSRSSNPITPKPTLSHHGAAILQTLLCTRYIHAGLFASAIKLDAQFSIAPPAPSSSSQGSEEAARAVAEERKKMIAEVWSVLGGVERAEVEEEVKGLVKKGQGMNMAQVSKRARRSSTESQLSMKPAGKMSGPGFRHRRRTLLKTSPPLPPLDPVLQPSHSSWDVDARLWEEHRPGHRPPRTRSTLRRIHILRHRRARRVSRSFPCLLQHLQVSGRRR